MYIIGLILQIDVIDHLKSICTHNHWNGRLTATSPNELGDHILIRVLDPCDGCNHVLLADVKSFALQSCKLLEYWQVFEGPVGEEEQLQGHRQRFFTDLNEASTVPLTCKFVDVIFWNFLI